MLTYTDIQRLASEGEGKSIEFKETTGQLDRGMETLCAFLNGNGGTLLFGITDNGKIIGQDISDKTRRDIADALLKFEPIPELSTSFVRTQQANRYAIAIEVKGQQYARPFMYKGRAYHRKVLCRRWRTMTYFLNVTTSAIDGNHYPATCP